MIRQVLIKFPLINYASHSIINKQGLTHLVSTNCVGQVRLYSVGPNSPVKKLKKIAYTTGALVLGSSGVLIYAKYDADFQSWLSSNVPGYDSITKNFNKSNLFQIYIADPVVNFKSMLVESATGLIGKSESDSKTDKPKQATTDTAKSESKTPDLYVKKNEVPSSTPVNISDFEKTLTVAFQECVTSYKDLKQVVADYTDEVQQLIDHSFQELDPRLWAELGRKQEKKQILLKVAEEKINAAMKVIDKVQCLLQDSNLPTASDVRHRIAKNLSQTRNDVLDIKKKLKNEFMSPAVTDKFWKDVKEARKYFFEELENLMANKSLYDTKLRLTDDELNLFLMYAYQKILYYQRELSRIDGTKEKEMAYALSKLKEKDEIIEATVQIELEKERRRLQEEFEKKELAVLVEANRRTRAQVKLQAEAHADLLREATFNKEAELKRKFQRQLEVKIDELKSEGSLTMAGVVGRLKGYNDAIKQRLLEKKQAKEAQELWCACHTLQTAVELPLLNAKPMADELRPLDKIVKNIVDRSEGDEFVQCVVSSIPKVALSRGVYPTMSLKTRFAKVEQVALQLAEVDESDITIPKLFVSWLNNFLTIKDQVEIPVNEYNNELIDPTSLTTSDILNRARYWLHRNDFLQAVRYMNLLRGAPKEAAKDWVKETVILLETLQAANALLAHCVDNFAKTS